MANFNRGRQSRGRDFNRRGFEDRGSRGPVEMHKAICDRCGKECEVPFRPTGGKPIYCSSCFESNKGSGSRRFDDRNSKRSTNFEDRPMFEAVCDNCGNSCKVPFQPRGNKPIYCSNCFGEKKGAGSRENDQSQPQFKEQLESLNNKLDRILQLLGPNSVLGVAQEELDQQPQEQSVATEETKVVKKRSSKKK